MKTEQHKTGVILGKRLLGTGVISEVDNRLTHPRPCYGAFMLKRQGKDFPTIVESLGNTKSAILFPAITAKRELVGEVFGVQLGERKKS